MGQAPHGQRECVNCVYYHPEREKKCSVFGKLENKNKDCSIYDEVTERRLARSWRC